VCAPAVNDDVKFTVRHVLQFAVAGNDWFATNTAPSISTLRLATPFPAEYRNANVVEPAAVVNENVTNWPCEPQQHTYGLF